VRLNLNRSASANKRSRRTFVLTLSASIVISPHARRRFRKIARAHFEGDVHHGSPASCEASLGRDKRSRGCGRHPWCPLLPREIRSVVVASLCSSFRHIFGRRTRLLSHFAMDGCPRESQQILRHRISQGRGGSLFILCHGSSLFPYFPLSRMERNFSASTLTTAAPTILSLIRRPVVASAVIMAYVFGILVFKSVPHCHFVRRRMSLRMPLHPLCWRRLDRRDIALLTSPSATSAPSALYLCYYGFSVVQHLSLKGR